MSDDEFLSDIRDELFRRNSGMVGLGRTWMIIAFLLRKLEEKE